jgi:hypothetical protein
MKISVPFRLLNIEGDGYHIALNLRINGKAANAIIDTGASKTVFDKERITAFLKKEKLSDNERLSTGLGTTSMQSHVATLKSVSIGKLSIRNYDSVILDLSHVNKTYTVLGLKPIDGVLGSDILEKHRAIIDYGKKKLILHGVEPKKPAKRSPKKSSPKKKVALKKGAKKKSAKKKR